MNESIARISEYRPVAIDGKEFVVHAYDVIGTGVVVFEAMENPGPGGMWEYGSVHSSPTYGFLGYVHTRIPDSEARRTDDPQMQAKVQAHYAQVRDRAWEVIQAAYPELIGQLVRDGGRARCTVEAFRAVTV